MGPISEEREPLAGFWLGLAGLVLVFSIPFVGVIAAIIGFSLSARAYQRLASGAPRRRLALAGIVLGGAGIAVVVINSILSLLFRI